LSQTPSRIASATKIQDNLEKTAITLDEAMASLDVADCGTQAINLQRLQQRFFECYDNEKKKFMVKRKTRNVRR
jgi:hypothetical protein